MYTIKWVADQLGVAPGTLRAWEHRYAVVAPARTEAGHRIYSEHDLAVLRAMARLVGAGIQPAQAAEQLRNGGRVRPSGNQVADGSPGLPAPSDLVAAAAGYDLPALEATLDAAFSAATFEHVAGSWLMTALDEVGDAWHRGELDVAQEHFVSASIMRRLSPPDAAGQARFGKRILIGLAPGATHEIATLAFATMLRRAGLAGHLPGPRPAGAQLGGGGPRHQTGRGGGHRPRPADGTAAAEVMCAARAVAGHPQPRRRAGRARTGRHAGRHPHRRAGLAGIDRERTLIRRSEEAAGWPASAVWYS